jgi:hypothetical protein
MLGYGLVLLLVTASASIQLLVSESNAARLAVLVLQAATLVVAVRTSGARRPGVRLASLAAGTAAIASLGLWIVHGDIPRGTAAVVNGLLVAVAPLAIAAGLVRELRRDRRVTVSTLAGVLAIYLLTGMFFSFLYAVIGSVDPGSLFAGRHDSTAADQLYFSFVTLSTVGYGDFAPAAHAPRALAVAEMLIGQIYLVTVVSLIVGNLGRGTPARRT